MGVPPPLNPPRLGDLIADDECAYARRTSADHQAAIWNEVLATDPVCGPSSGCVVGVASVGDLGRRFALVWIRALLATVAMRLVICLP